MTIRSEVRLNHKLTVGRKIERKRERKRTFLKIEHAQHLGSTHSLSLSNNSLSISLSASSIIIIIIIY